MLNTVTDLKVCKDSARVNRQFTGITRLLFTLIILLWTGGSWLAAETRVVTADPSLAAGPVKRLLLGADYRDLWTTPIEVEVLDFSTEAGGLKPLFRVGGAQTFGLAMKGADGKSYTFRSLIKEQAQNLHESLRDYALGRITQDQLATIHPASVVMVPPLAKAAGVLHNNPKLILLPDDPALGEFRELFAGRIGTIEQFPTEASDEYAGFAGATEIIKSFDIVPQWLASPDVRIDARALLRLRLFDFFLGDWDRHANNHRWAKIPGKPDWQPLPEDRDQAFVDFRGLLPALARPFDQRLLRLKENKYPSSFGLTQQGWPIHRWFLAELDRAAWIETANDLRNRITDDVIEEALSLMPQPYFELSADKLRRIIKGRRDNLPEIAERIYLFMSKELDVQATEKNDRIDLRDLGQGQLQVSVALKDGGSPYFLRQLNADDTKSLRLYLRGGQNILDCHGLVGGGIKIEVIGNHTNDVIQGCKAANLRFTESEEIEQRKEEIRVAPNPFETVGLPTKNVPPDSDRPRDWGSNLVPNYIARIDSDDGLVVGGGFTLQRFAFGRNPFGQRHMLTAGVSSNGGFEASYTGTYQPFNPKLQYSLAANITSIDEADFFGFGNDTSDDGDSDFFDTDQTRTTITPSLDYVLSSKVNLFTGVEFNINSTDDDDDSLLNELAPLGVGDFNWAGLFGGINYDTRDRTVVESPGFHFRLEGSFSPAALDLDDSFTSVEGEIAGFIGLGERSLLALRLGGRNVEGDFPFQEAAYLGGRTDVRGLDTDRFAGDASVFANAEIRFKLGEASAYVARAEYGLFFFADVGRVFLEDEDEDDLHPAAGGGVSITALDGTFVVSAAIATSEERTKGIFNAGFTF